MDTNARRPLQSYTSSRRWDDGYRPAQGRNRLRPKYEKITHHQLPEWQVGEQDQKADLDARGVSIFPGLAYIVLSIVCFAHVLSSLNDNIIAALPLFILSIGVMLYGIGRLIEGKNR